MQKKLVLKKLSNEELAKIFFISFLMVYFLNSSGLSTLVAAFSSLCLLALNQFQFPKKSLSVILPFIGIFLTGFLVAVFSRNNGYEVAKDAWYFIKPVLYIVFGTLLFKHIKEIGFMVKWVTWAATVLAILHLIKLSQIDFMTMKVEDIRQAAGSGNSLEMLALIFFTSSFRYPLLRSIKSRKVYFLLIGLIAISFLLYFSRTYLAGFIILFMSSRGWLKFTFRKTIYLLGFTSVLVLGFYWLQTMEFEPASLGFKIQNIPQELMPHADYETKREINQNWRGYEAGRALMELEKRGLSAYIFGNGLGSMVDLGFEIPLGGVLHRYVPHIHNGYVYILLKSGAIGLILYLLAFFRLYLFNYYKNRGTPVSYYSKNMVSGIALYFFLTTVVIAGIYNKGDIVTLFLGAFIMMYYNQKRSRNERYAVGS